LSTLHPILAISDRASPSFYPAPPGGELCDRIPAGLCGVGRVACVRRPTEGRSRISRSDASRWLLCLVAAHSGTRDGRHSSRRRGLSLSPSGGVGRCRAASAWCRLKCGLFPPRGEGGGRSVPRLSLHPLGGVYWAAFFPTGSERMPMFRLPPSVTGRLCWRVGVSPFRAVSAGNCGLGVPFPRGGLSLHGDGGSLELGRSLTVPGSQIMSRAVLSSAGGTAPLSRACASLPALVSA